MFYWSASQRVALAGLLLCLLWAMAFWAMR
jgi:hypothetical protein